MCTPDNWKERRKGESDFMYAWRTTDRANMNTPNNFSGGLEGILGVIMKIIDEHKSDKVKEKK